MRILWEFFENSLGIIWEFMIFENERNLCFCQDFGVMQGRKEGRKEGQEFRSLEVRSKLIALKKTFILQVETISTFIGPFYSAIYNAGR